MVVELPEEIARAKKPARDSAESESAPAASRNRREHIFRRAPRPDKERPGTPAAAPSCDQGSIVPRRGRLQRLKKYSLRTGIIYGPAPSRRLGLSLGINLLPTSYKLCSFNCIYCQYGWTPKATLAPAHQLKDLPTPAEVSGALEMALNRLSEEEDKIDSITICGNGEPTLYPQLAEVVAMTKQARDRFQPQARVAILSNSSTVGDPAVRDTLELLDLKIMKFDAGSEEMFRQLNQPEAPIYIGEIIGGLKQLKNIFLQSLFVQGRITNADPDSIDVWIDGIRAVHPLGVQVYTLDREPADRRIEKVSRATLEWLVEQVRWRAGVPAEAY